MKFHESKNEMIVSTNCSQERNRVIKCFILMTTCKQTQKCSTALRRNKPKN